VLTPREETLVTLAVHAARPEYRDLLQSGLEAARTKGNVSRSEIYEAFLQQYLFVGFPSALEAMKALGRAWPDEADIRQHRELTSYTGFLERGQELYAKIYSKNAGVVRDEMMRLSPDLAAWAVIEGYGKTLSREGLDVLTRELCIVGILTQLGWQRQLFSHIMGALNVGASKEQVKAAITIGAYEKPEHLDKALRLLDKA
jgi:alkylhydroperoxidase/carboxymuconolactone decarboxylase family protein YurZ